MTLNPKNDSGSLADPSVRYSTSQVAKSDYHDTVKHVVLEGGLGISEARWTG